MKPGVMLINCARGGIINEADLYDAIVVGQGGRCGPGCVRDRTAGGQPLAGPGPGDLHPPSGCLHQAEAQANVAVMVAQQIIDYLTTGTIVNAVNVPSVTGELLEKIGPYLKLAEQLGLLQAQLIKGAPKEVVVEYYGDFKGIDLSPITTALLKGLLTPMVKEVVNFVNAHVLANQRGIKVTETTIASHEEYTYLITAKLVTTEGESVVRDHFRQAGHPHRAHQHLPPGDDPLGHMALIHNWMCPAPSGRSAPTLGKHNINIARMQVGQETGGDRNIIFLCTDTPIPPETVEELRSLRTVKTVTPLEFLKRGGEAHGRRKQGR
jgi:D-3-phosphoglycerate dehydrogenase / 2-oxoglutarate reductase